jgi:hypothetical protein
VSRELFFKSTSSLPPPVIVVLRLATSAGLGELRAGVVGDSRIGWNPRTYVRRNSRIYTKKESENAETRNLRKPDFLLQSRESLYTCPRTPFYRETKGLLHSEITLESREYS